MTCEMSGSTVAWNGTSPSCIGKEHRALYGFCGADCGSELNHAYLFPTKFLKECTHGFNSDPKLVIAKRI